MIARLALALGVTADELLGIKPAQNQTHQPKLKIQKRINAIEKLPTSQQKALLKTIDAFLKAAQL